jgi:hypothetical protein
MKNTFLAALVLLTAACGAYHFPAGSTGSGSVSGTVMAVPCAPVEAAGVACAGRPVPNLELDFTSAETTATAVTDSLGRYSIELPAADYRVSLRTSLHVLSGPSTLTVQPGSKVVANYLLDSGIRVPVPQQ